MAEKNPTSFQLSDIDKADIQVLLEYGVYTHASDAARSCFRRGMREEMEERGIPRAKVSVPVEEVSDENANTILPAAEQVGIRPLPVGGSA